MHSSQSGLLCALHFTEEDFSLTLTSEFVRRTGGQSHSMPCVQAAGFCVCYKPSPLLTECLADFILWGFWDVFVRRALLLTLAAVATFWELKRIQHTVCSLGKKTAGSCWKCRVPWLQGCPLLLLHGLCPVFGSQSFNSARCLSPSSDVLKVLDNAVEALNLWFLSCWES